MSSVARCSVNCGVAPLTRMEDWLWLLHQATSMQPTMMMRFSITEWRACAMVSAGSELSPRFAHFYRATPCMQARYMLRQLCLSVRLSHWYIVLKRRNIDEATVASSVKYTRVWKIFDFRQIYSYISQRTHNYYNYYGTPGIWSFKLVRVFRKQCMIETCLLQTTYKEVV